MCGVHSTRPMMNPLAHSPPAAPPSTDQAASIAREQATRQQITAPQRDPVCRVQVNRDRQQPVLQRARVEHAVGQPGGLSAHRAVRGQRVPRPQGDGRLVADRPPAVPDEANRAGHEGQPGRHVCHHAEHDRAAGSSRNLALRAGNARPGLVSWDAEHGRLNLQRGLLFGLGPTNLKRAQPWGADVLLHRRNFAGTKQFPPGDMPMERRICGSEDRDEDRGEAMGM